MGEYVTLIGAEDVRSAASSMRDSAETMRQAASTIDYANQQLRQRMDSFHFEMSELVDRLEKVLVGDYADKGK